MSQKKITDKAVHEALLKAATDAFTIESESLIETGKITNPDALLQAVEALAKAERIAASGCGHSGIACQHFTHLMCCIERPARFIYPSEAVHGATGFLKKGDVMLLASRGGNTDELMPIAAICRRFGVTVLALTEKTDSPLANAADIVLPIAVTRECDKYNCQGTTSFAVMCAVFDALQSALIEYTDFQNEDFAVIHPGGAVGKRLNQQK